MVPFPLYFLSSMCEVPHIFLDEAKILSPLVLFRLFILLFSLPLKNAFPIQIYNVPVIFFSFYLYCFSIMYQCLFPYFFIGMIVQNASFAFALFSLVRSLKCPTPACTKSLFPLSLDSCSSSLLQITYVMNALRTDLIVIVAGHRRVLLIYTALVTIN